MFLFIFEGERERERQSMSRGGTEREGDRESKAGSRLWAVSTESNAGLEPMNCEIMRWSQTLNQLSHPGTPILHIFNPFRFFYHSVPSFSRASDFLNILLFWISYTKVHCFIKFSSFDKCIISCVRHHGNTHIFTILKITCDSLSHQSPPHPLSSMNHSLFYWLYSLTFLECHITGIIYYVVLGGQSWCTH